MDLPAASPGEKMMFAVAWIAVVVLFVCGVMGGGWLACRNGGGTMQKPFTCVDPVIVSACEFNDRVYTLPMTEDRACTGSEDDDFGCSLLLNNTGVLLG